MPHERLPCLRNVRGARVGLTSIEELTQQGFRTARIFHRQERAEQALAA